MATYDADLQTAVDSTSAAHDAGETDLLGTLRQMLAQRDIQTSDQAWLERTVEGIKSDRNYMIQSEPEDFTPRHEVR